VKIPLHELLLELRRDLVERRVGSLRERVAMTFWSILWSRVPGYRLSTFASRLGQPLAGKVGPGKVWAGGRGVPGLSRRRFRDWK
jgi:hypothetical protein